MSKKRNPDINIVYYKFGHHSEYSGYDQIVNHLKNVKIISSSFQSVIDKFRKFLPDSVYAWFSKRQYTVELNMLIPLFLKKKAIFHHLYGENSYIFSGFFKNSNKIICTFHHTPDILKQVISWKGIARKSRFKKIDGIIILSRSQLPALADLIESEKIYFVPHGVDTKYFRPLNCVKGKNKRCLVVGNWLRDFNLLRKVIQIVNHRDPAINFKIVTLQRNFNLFKDLKNVDLLAGISNKELLEEYNRADILLLPLLDCVANNALLEGMACGLPIIATDVGGIREYADGSHTVFTTPGDSIDMAEKLLEIFNDSDKLRSMAVASRKKALEYDWDIIADKIKNVYHKISLS